MDCIVTFKRPRGGAGAGPRGSFIAVASPQWRTRHLARCVRGQDDASLPKHNAGEGDQGRLFNLREWNINITLFGPGPFVTSRAESQVAWGRSFHLRKRLTKVWGAGKREKILAPPGVLNHTCLNIIKIHISHASVLSECVIDLVLLHTNI